MHNLFRSIQDLQTLLLQADISSIVIGGVAVAAWGEPRLTRDIDLKVLLGRKEAERLLSIISTGYQPLVTNPLKSLQKQALIFVQDSLGTRLDILLADTPYDVMAIKRGRDIEIQPGVIIHLCSPEDLVIYKLISTRLRDYDDARSVIQRQGDALDNSYIIHWLEQFEQALNDSTLVHEYQNIRQEFSK